ncbi:MAG: AzlD domain-containing protein [Trueperaceae bacterium]
MSPTLTIFFMALVTYVPRLLGFILSGQNVSPFWLRFFRFVPITVFAALIFPAIPGTSGEVIMRIIASVLAMLAIWRLKSLWVGIVVGMGAFWLLRLL